MSLFIYFSICETYCTLSTKSSKQFESKSRIATKTLDNGVNIKNVNLRHLVIQNLDQTIFTNAGPKPLFRWRGRCVSISAKYSQRTAVETFSITNSKYFAILNFWDSASKRV